MDTRSKTRAAKDPPPTSMRTRSQAKAANDPPPTSAATASTTKTTVQTTRKKKSNNANANAIITSKRAGGDPPTDRNPPAADPSLASLAPIAADNPVLSAISGMIDEWRHRNDIDEEELKQRTEKHKEQTEKHEQQEQSFAAEETEQQKQLFAVAAEQPLLSYSFPTAKPQGGSTTDNAATTNNESVAATMLARRRRRAQLEMFRGDSSTSGSVVSVGDRGASIGSIESGASIGGISTTASSNDMYVAFVDYTKVPHDATAVGGTAPSGSTASAGDVPRAQSGNVEILNEQGAPPAAVGGGVIHYTAAAPPSLNGSIRGSVPAAVPGSTSKQSTKGATADSLPPLCRVGDTIDLDSLPKRLFPEEAATVFPLKNNSSNNGQQHFVIVGTIAIVTASSEAGSKGRKVNITWWCRRSTQTLTLNVEATGVILADANGRMPLIFESSDSCLDFVQAFLRGPSKSVSQVSSPSQQPPASEEVPKESTESELVRKKDESSGLVGDGNIKADLTEEETLEGVQANVMAAVLGADEGTKNTEKKTKKEGEVTDPRQALLDAIKKKGNGGDNSTKPPVPTDPKPALFAATKGKGAEPSQSKLSDEEDRVASKYRRMLKMGIPLDAVKHEMQKEGVDPKIASAVADEAPPHVTLIEHVTPDKPKSKSGSTAGPVLSEEEEEIASKYRKMLQYFVPKDAVRHDMKKEGVGEKIVEAIFGKEDTIDTVNNMETPAKGKNTKTKGIYWTANNLGQGKLEGTIFGRSATKNEPDIKKLEELFPKNDNGKVKSGETNAGSGMAKLLDITRANNIAIQLKAFNDFTLEALAETINDLDPDRKIVGERVQFIPQLLPTPNELQAIKEYKGDSDRLNAVELFFQQLLPFKRVKDKVAVVKAMRTFNEHAKEARAAFKTLEVVCGQVLNSAKLVQIIEMVLKTGNLMNEGSLDGGVEAFKFESLPKLSQTKSADGKTTVLDYIVETFIEKGARETLFLDSDFPDIQESCRLSINDLCGDVNTLRKNYQLCKTELSSMKKDQAPKPAKGIPKKMNEGEAADPPRNALLAAIQRRGANDDDDSAKPPLAAIKNKGADASATTAPGSNIKYSRGVKRLESFIPNAETSLSLTERYQGAALRACRGLAVYCGEEGGERSASLLLQILSAFASSLKVAVEKYDKRSELSKRQKAQNKSVPQAKDEENEVNGLPKKKPLLKASSLQPLVGLKSVDPRQELFAAIQSRRQE